MSIFGPKLKILVNKVRTIIQMDLVTISSLGFISIAAVGYAIPLFKVYKLSQKLKDCSTLTSLSDLSIPKIHELVYQYKESMKISPSEGIQKTTLRAEDLFNEEQMALVANTNMHAIMSAPGVLSGLGVLGTFIGLAVAVTNFDSSNAEMISISIRTLLSGMGTAFYTSLLGMSLSITYIFFQKATFNQLGKNLLTLCSTLDKTFYISDLDVIRMESAEQTKIQNEGLLMQLRQSYADQAQSLKQWSGEVVNATQQSFKATMIEQQEKANKDNQEFSRQIISSFQSKLEEQTDYGKDQHAKLASAIHTITNELKNQSATILSEKTKDDDLLKQMIRISHEQAESFKQWSENIVNTTQQSFKATIIEQQEKVNKENQEINNQIISGFQNKLEKQAEYDKGQHTELVSAIQALTNEFKSQSANLLNEKTKEDDILKQMIQLNHEQAESFKQWSEKVVNASQQSFKATMIEQQEKVNKENQEISSQIISGFQDKLEKQAEYDKGQHTELVSAIQTLTNEFKSQSASLLNEKIREDELLRQMMQLSHEQAESSKHLRNELEEQTNHGKNQHAELVNAIKGMATEVKNQSSILSESNHQIMLNLQTKLEEQASRRDAMHTELMEAITFYDEEDNKSTIGNALQSLYEEAEKQSQALESFTTDLSNELNTSLGRTMNENIVPLIHDIEKTHLSLGQKLDSMSNQIQAPATEMVTRVTGDLKAAMVQMTEDFKEQISTDTVNQMTALANNLQKTSEILNLVPQTMEAMSDNIKKNFSNVQGLFGQIQNTIQDQQTQMIENSRNVSDELTIGMQIKFEEMMGTVKDTMSKLNEQHMGVMDTQSRSTREIERLLASFADSVQRMHISNQETSNSLVKRKHSANPVLLKNL
jgi:hypothetical protein